MYGKPPQSRQFKPGQSGNPNGRPKRLKEQNIIEIIQQIVKLYTNSKLGDTHQSLANQKLKKIKETLVY